MWDTHPEPRGGAAHLGGGALADPRPGRAAQAARGVSFYEERLLFLLIRLRNPRARMVYVTSQPVHPMILEYYFQFLAGIPASHARARLTLLCAHDASPRSLTEKILERPRLLQRIRDGIVDTEPRLPHRLQLHAAGAQAGRAARHPAERRRPEPHPPGHEVGQPQGVPRGGRRPAEGIEDLRTEHEVENALRRAARAQRPRHPARGGQAERQLLGRGQRALPLPRGRRRARRCRRRCSSLEFSVPTETPEVYFDKFARMGGIVEEFIEAPEKDSPSRAAARQPARRGGRRSRPTTRSSAAPAARSSSAAASPPTTTTGCRSQEAGAPHRHGAGQPRRGQPLRGGLPGLARSDGQTEWKLAALEINLRMGGTTHPYLALQFLTGGQLDHATGLFLLADRPRQVLPRDRQPEVGPLPRPAAGGPDRDPHRQQAPLQPRHRVGRALPPDRRALGVRQARPDRDRQQPRGGGRPLPAHAGRARPGERARPRSRDPAHSGPI